ncbi:heavy metal translocating P-type ATPase [Haploplasma modicum]|nr:heavy metal translocating P-type ATPase [Haploplasma modicum]MCR1809203.1 heavy metal translocating P-type ATPase [Haploplasma modicum]
MSKITSFILKNKIIIIILNAILIVLGFLTKWIFKNDLLFEIFLIAASIIGILPIMIQAFSALRYKLVTIDLLVTIAVLGAFIIKNYEESAIVTFLFLFGAFLEQKTIGKARSAIKKLIDFKPQKALKKIDDDYVLVDVDDVLVGDIVLVKTGAKIPVEGNVLKGLASVDESSITGESKPVAKEEGSLVFASTIVDNGTIEVVATKVGDDTTYSKIIHLVEEAQDSKSKAEKFIDSFAKYYTPFVLLLGLLVFIIFKDINLAVSILVLGCPGALVIGVPVSSVSGIGSGARNGVLLKGSESINDFAKAKTFIFDKTGTLTMGSPRVIELINIDNDNEILEYLYSVEKESLHPLANAITNHLGDMKTHEISNTLVLKGYGIKASIDNNLVLVGNVSLFENENIFIDNKFKTKIKELENDGQTIVLVGKNNKLKLVLGIKDKIRDNVKTELSKLRKLGAKKLILLSGDNQTVVDQVALELNFDLAFGNMLPEDKSNYVKELKSMGEIVVFVGDGINDSPSLALANVSIAMGSGTEVAIETSDIVLMNSSFGKLTFAYGLTKKITRNMKQNIIIALLVVLVLVIGLIFSDLVDMSVGMLVHELSILVVILNGMRLLKYKLKGENNEKSRI